MDTSRMAKALGRRGGLARSRRLSADEKQHIASLGGKARLRSLRAARRILDNLRYAGAVAELRGHRAVVVRVSDVTGRLPGIYPTRA